MICREYNPGENGERGGLVFGRMLAMSIYKDDRCERDEAVIDGKEGSSEEGGFV